MTEEGTTGTLTRYGLLPDLPPAYELIPFLLVTGFVMWWLGRRLHLSAEAWLGVWFFFMVVGAVDSHRLGALGLSIAAAGSAGFYVTAWWAVRKRLPA